MLHPPQLVGSVRVFASQPSLVSPLQFPNPALHALSTQLLAEQLAVAFGKLQTCPQVPQFSGLVVRLISQPFEASPSQLPKPALHEIEQAPMLQPGVPFWLLHTLPQPP